jgi:hypothetical protein
MDIQSTKISFVQEFLRLKNEQSIKRLVELLHQEKVKQYESELKPMSEKELNDIVDQAEEDARAGRVTAASSLRKDIDNWT